MPTTRKRAGGGAAPGARARARPRAAPPRARASSATSAISRERRLAGGARDLLVRRRAGRRSAPGGGGRGAAHRGRARSRLRRRGRGRGGSTARSARSCLRVEQQDVRIAKSGSISRGCCASSAGEEARAGEERGEAADQLGPVEQQLVVEAPAARSPRTKRSRLLSASTRSGDASISRANCSASVSIIERVSRAGEQLRLVAHEELEDRVARSLSVVERGAEGARRIRAAARVPPRSRRAPRRRRIPSRAPAAAAPAGAAAARGPGARPPSASGSRRGAGRGRRAAASSAVSAGSTLHLGEARERALRRAVAQLRDATAVQQLQRLRDELDVADAARVELHVEAVVAGAAPVLRARRRRAVAARGCDARPRSPSPRGRSSDGSRGRRASRGRGRRRPGRAFMKATFSQWSAAFS